MLTKAIREVSACCCVLVLVWYVVISFIITPSYFLFCILNLNSVKHVIMHDLTPKQTAMEIWGKKRTYGMISKISWLFAYNSLSRFREIYYFVRRREQAMFVFLSLDAFNYYSSDCEKIKTLLSCYAHVCKIF